uniref:Polyhomeotic homolog 3 n=1 Tax=Latimeria chalumnae TaxID=7897 RepID=H3B5J6_LATCH
MENEQNTPVPTVTTATSTSSRTQTPQISVYSGTDRQAVQVIQQTLHRPQSTAAQYLQQMYAAQQQHLMLQTAALQQQHLSSTQLQSLASVQQASLSGGRQSSSPTGSVTQQSSTSQTSINLSTSPAATQLISRSQTSSTSSSSITQQTMLLGSTSPTLTASQAQMYLRAQMLIFTPATVTAVQPDIPVVSSSSQSATTQVQNLALRSQQLSSTSQSVPLKSPNQVQTLAIGHSKAALTGSKVTQSESSSESSKKGESPSPEFRTASVTRTSGPHQLLSPAPYAPIQPHLLVKHQQVSLQQPPQKGPAHQLIIQPPQQQLQHRQPQQQVQPLVLQNSTPETQPHQHCMPVQTHAPSLAPSSVPPQHCPPVQIHPSLAPSPTHSPPVQQTVVVSPQPTHSPPSQPPAIIIQPHALIASPLPLGSNQHQPSAIQTSSSQQPGLPCHLPPAPSPVAHIGPIQQSNLVSSGQQPVPHPQQPHQAPQPLAMSPPSQLSVTPPTQIPPLPLQSTQAVAVQPEILSSGPVMAHNALISEEDLPAAEALVQMPFQTLLPPQTVAVNLQVQPSAPVEQPAVYQVEGMCEEELREEREETQIPMPPALSPSAVPVFHGQEPTSAENTSEQAATPPVTSSACTSVIKSPTDASLASMPSPPLALPAAKTRSNSISVSPGTPSTENRPPQAIVKPHILTHVIEGFVIQEGLEPFPVSRSSLLIEQPVKQKSHSESQEMNSQGTQSESEFQNTKHAENSTDTDMDDITAEATLWYFTLSLLKTTFGCQGLLVPRANRKCTRQKFSRYNVSCTKRLGLFKSDKANRWNRKSDSQSLGRRGRRPSGSDGMAREHFQTQLPITYPLTEDIPASQSQLPHEDPVPAAMTTRLRRQTERERELRMRDVPEAMDMLPIIQTDPSFWSVDEVWAFIHSLPGCQDIADEFRAQEIDGQALLLLKEDHLMSAMNIKLGPALKICARINSLKES